MSRKEPSQKPAKAEPKRILPKEPLVKSKGPMTARDGASKSLPPSTVETLPDIHQKKSAFQLGVDDDDFGVEVSSPRETAMPASVAPKPLKLGVAGSVAEAVTKLKGGVKTARTKAGDPRLTSDKPKEPKIYHVLFGEGDRQEKHSRAFVNRVAKSNEGKVINVRDIETNAEYTVKYAGLGDPVWVLIPHVQTAREKTKLELLIERAMDPEISNLSDDCGDLRDLMRDVNDAIRITEHIRAVDQLAGYLLAVDVVFFSYDEVEFFFNEDKVRCALRILDIFSNPASAFTADLWQKLMCIYLSDDVRRKQMVLMETILNLLDAKKSVESDAEKYALVDDVMTNFCDPVNLYAIEAIQARLTRCGIPVTAADSHFMLAHPVLSLLNSITHELSVKSSLDAVAWDFIKEQMQPKDYLAMSIVLDDGLSEKVSVQAILQKTREGKSPVDEAVALRHDPSFRRLGASSGSLRGAGSFHSKAKLVTGTSSPRTLSRSPSCRSVASEGDLTEVVSDSAGRLPTVATVGGNLAAPQSLFGGRRTPSRVQLLVDEAAKTKDQLPTVTGSPR